MGATRTLEKSEGTARWARCFIDSDANNKNTEKLEWHQQCYINTCLYSVLDGTFYREKSDTSGTMEVMCFMFYASTAEKELNS